MADKYMDQFTPEECPPDELFDAFGRFIHRRAPEGFDEMDMEFTEGGCDYVTYEVTYRRRKTESTVKILYSLCPDGRVYLDSDSNQVHFPALSCEEKLLGRC